MNPRIQTICILAKRPVFGSSKSARRGHPVPNTYILTSRDALPLPTRLVIAATLSLVALAPAFAYNAGNSADPERERELRHLYGPDDIYWYAAWLEANGGLGDAPRVTIHNSTVAWSFTDSKENRYNWSMPIVTYENLIKHSAEKSTRGYETHRLAFSSGGTTTMPAFEGFVTGAFGKVIDNVYENSRGDYDFVYEVWHIVSQMTVYDKDVDPSSEGRFALETFTRGGGDCEDLAILVADMLRSSSHTQDWDIQLAYMDADRPRAPRDVNHVLVLVDIGESTVIVEATAKPDMYSDYSYYPDGIRGWFYDV